jgi:hypothetical protein
MRSVRELADERARKNKMEEVEELETVEEEENPNSVFIKNLPVRVTFSTHSQISLLPFRPSCNTHTWDFPAMV